MIAVGCLALVVLPLVGLVLGLVIGTAKLAIGLAAGGFAVAALACGIGGWALVKAGRLD